MELVATVFAEPPLDMVASTEAAAVPAADGAMELASPGFRGGVVEAVVCVWYLIDGMRHPDWGALCVRMPRRRSMAS